MHGESPEAPQPEERRILETRERVREMQAARKEIDHGLHVLAVTCEALDDVRSFLGRAGEIALGTAEASAEQLAGDIADALNAALETIKGAVVGGVNLLHGHGSAEAPELEIVVSDSARTVINGAPVLSLFEEFVDDGVVRLPDAFLQPVPPSADDRKDLASRLALVSMQLHQEGQQYRQHIDTLVGRADFVRTMIETLTSALLPRAEGPLSEDEAIRLASTTGSRLRAARDIPALAPLASSSILELF